MKRRTIHVSTLFALGLALLPFTASAGTAVDLKLGMRQLWEDHVTWTRLFIVSALADLPDKSATTDRLLKNQVDIGNAIKPYYGDAAGEKLSALLKQHILIAADIVTAAKANDTANRRRRAGWPTPTRSRRSSPRRTPAIGPQPR
jgi:hypothetical protein